EEARTAFKSAAVYSKDLKVDRSKKEDNILSDGTINNYIQKFLEKNNSGFKKDIAGKQNKHISGKPSITVNVYSIRQLKKVLEAGPSGKSYIINIYFFIAFLCPYFQYIPSSYGPPALYVN
ncbi:unnamed protein product, partial [marine sediment metagenome]